MYRVFVVKTENGVTVMWPTSAVPEGMSIEEFALTVVPEGSDWRAIKPLELPNSREFRNAWVDVTPEPQIDIDLAKAKEIQLERLRAARNAELAATDGLLARALEQNNAAELEKLRVKRQALRDVTEELKAVPAGGYNDEAVINEIKVKGDPAKVEEIKQAEVVGGQLVKGGAK